MVSRKFVGSLFKNRNNIGNKYKHVDRSFQDIGAFGKEIDCTYQQRYWKNVERLFDVVFQITKYSLIPAKTFETATDARINPITRLIMLAPLFPIKR